VRPSSSSGQASAEYVAVVLLIAIVLGAAGTAVAAPDLPGAVVRTIRTGLCVVGGDICRTRDAEAKGLEPCVSAGEAHLRNGTVRIAVLRFGANQAFSVMQRSDGTYLVTAGNGQEVGLGTGAGLSLGPVFRVDASGAVTAGYQAGKTWELPDAAAVKALFARVREGFSLAAGLQQVESRLPAPTSVFHERRAGLEASIGAAVGDEAHATALEQRAAAEAMIGWERGPAGLTRSYALGASVSGAISRAIPQLATARSVVAELHDGSPRRLVLRSASTGAGQTTETVATLPLDRAGDAQLALKLIAHAAAPVIAPLAAREFTARVAARGSVERHTYEEVQDHSGFDVGAKLGLELGLGRDVESTTRRLVAADVTSGGRTLDRVVCVRRT
jgi:hypothetical protein